MKNQHAQRVCFILLCILAMAASADDPRTDLLQAWENLQANSTEVKAFRKIADKKYWIKFTRLPYEGELVVLAYDTEGLDYGGFDGIPYTLTGYVEVDLVDASAEETAKYVRSLGKWEQNSTLFYNQETQAWDSYKTYRTKLQQATENLAPSSGLLMLFEHAEYILISLLLYFLYVVASNGRRVKRSIALQEQALADFEIGRRIMRESLVLQRESNRLLQRVLEEMQNHPENQRR